MKIAGALVSTVAGILGLLAAIGSILFGVGTSLIGTSDSVQNILLAILELILCALITFFGSVSLKSKKQFVGIIIIMCSIINALLGGIITKFFMVLSLIGGIIALAYAKAKN